MYLCKGNFMMKIGEITRRCMCLLVLFTTLVGAYASVFGNTEENNGYYKQDALAVGYTAYTPIVYEPFSNNTPMQYNSLYVPLSNGQWQFPDDPAEPGMPPTAEVDDLPLMWIVLCLLLYACMKYKFRRLFQ